jgi:two-component system sensor kinase Ihk
MRKLKLFPKTFLYVFSPMAVVALMSHMLFYFMMPVVYTGQKESKFQAVRELLVEELKNASSDQMEAIVSQYAVQYKVNVYLNYRGTSYNYIVDSTASSERDDLQETVQTLWSVPSEVSDKDFAYLFRDFYQKTNSQLCSGSLFDAADKTPCYLLLLSTLQPVSEAKEAVVVFLPLTLLLSLLLSVIFALLYSSRITRTLSEISETTEQMKVLDPSALCCVKTQDEIGMLSENINALYESLLTTIDSLHKENVRVSEAEAAKVDFLRAASHELKTPVTALGGMLDNMIMGIGRYKDWETYLPVCRDMVRRFGVMIQEILDASKLNLSFESEAQEEIMMGALTEKVLSPYVLIAKTKGIVLDMNFSDDFSVKVPINAMEKALSNIISNGVNYTKPSGKINIYFCGRSIIVENECEPIPENVLSHIFEPFYRPDFSRSRNLDSENPEGGNGLGLYITGKVLDTLGFPFTFRPFTCPSGHGYSGMRFTIYFS